MTDRRKFLAGLLAAGLVPRPTWADAGGPAYLAAAGLADGRFALCGIGPAREILFRIALPGRGHAAAAHPHRPEAVAFARRPGTFAVVMDCATGHSTAQLTAPAGRHFYGHGAFSGDGRWLFTTENDFEAGQGRIGVWDASKRYRRVDEFASGGIGPHDIKRLPGTETLVVANGGIDTHPGSGRAKLNIPTMKPNLAYIENGAVAETAALAPGMHKNSIRHLAVSRDGLVAFGMQWQGGADAPPLVGMHRRGKPLQLCLAPDADLRAMDGYIGSIALSADGREIAATSPRGGRVQVFDAGTGALSRTVTLADASGVAADAAGFVVTGGDGTIMQMQGAEGGSSTRTRMMWDNHLVAIAG